MARLNPWKQRARQIKRDLVALYLAARDPRVPWYARLLTLCVVSYAFSPIDLIPDPIPLLGYLDDLILVPLGIVLVLRLIPPTVLAECRDQAQTMIDVGKPTSWVAAGVIVLIWILIVGMMLVGGMRLLSL